MVQFPYFSLMLIFNFDAASGTCFRNNLWFGDGVIDFINISTIKAPISTDKVSMLKLTIDGHHEISQ